MITYQDLLTFSGVCVAAVLFLSILLIKDSQKWR